MDETLLRYWPFILSGVGFVVWLVRMEARVNNLAISIEKMERQRVEDLKDAKEERAELRSLMREVSNKLDRFIERHVK
jgi:hypothetical protein